MKEKIEDFLGLSEEEIQRRMNELEKKIPTIPGIGYLEIKAKIFDVQPWPFISYLAHYDPNLLRGELECYAAYDGRENGEIIMEQLRERYIITRVLTKLKEKEDKANGKR